MPLHLSICYWQLLKEELSWKIFQNIWLIPTILHDQWTSTFVLWLPHFTQIHMWIRIASNFHFVHITHSVLIVIPFFLTVKSFHKPKFIYIFSINCHLISKLDKTYFSWAFKLVWTRFISCKSSHGIVLLHMYVCPK